MTVPATIPRRLVFRALADILGSQARRLDSLSSGRPGSRNQRSAVAAERSAGKAVGRARQAADLRTTAAVIDRWVADPDRTRGPGIDAAIVGYLIALAYGHASAYGELAAELADAGRAGLIDDVRWHDIVGIAARMTE